MQYEHVSTSSSSEGVSHGSSLATHATASLGPISVTCSGEINEQLWGAGAALAAHLYHNRNSPESVLSNSPAVLELGSGTGLPGLTAAMSGASSVVLTDLPSCVPFLQKSIEDNADALPESVRGSVTASSLPWGSPSAIEAVCPLGVDVILGADLLYNPNTFSSLLSTISRLARKRDCRIIIATEHRWDSVTEAWETAIAESDLEKLSSVEIPAPQVLPRKVNLVEFRLKSPLPPLPPPPAWQTTMFSAQSSRSHPSLGLSYLLASLPCRVLPLPRPLPTLQRLDSSHDLEKSLGVGTVIWDVALTLTHFLAHNPSLVKNRKVLDLGTGVGQLSIAAAILGCVDIIASDVEDLAGLVEKNIELAAHHLTGMEKKRALNVKYESYLWGILPTPESFENTDVIVLSDCLYDTGAFNALMPTLTSILTPTTITLIAYHRRIDDREIPMFEALSLLMDLHVIPWPCDFHDSYLIVGCPKKTPLPSEYAALLGDFDLSSVLDKDDERWQKGDSLAIPHTLPFMVKVPPCKLLALRASKFGDEDIALEMNSESRLLDVTNASGSYAFPVPEKATLVIDCAVSSGIERTVTIGYLLKKVYTNLCSFDVEGINGVTCEEEDDCYVVFGDANCGSERERYMRKITRTEEEEAEEEARLFREAVEQWRVERPEARIVDSNM
jgi:predicted nicotinamide N-methyase